MSLTKINKEEQARVMHIAFEILVKFRQGCPTKQLEINGAYKEVKV